MTEEIEDYHKDAIVVANASTFRHSAKISYIQMVHMIIGFAHGTSITEVAAITKTHRDTVRDIYAAFRDRLSEPRFEKWIQSAYASPRLSNAEDAALMEEARTALFGCHQNIDCLKRYRAGRRKTRVCRACPIRSYVKQSFEDTREAGAGWVGGRQPALETDEDGFEKATESLVELIDNVRDFYALLGWKEHRGVDEDERAIFEKRFRHYEVISTALTSSSFDKTGGLTSDEDDFLSIPHFAKVLTAELKENPLR